jgi:hypothetical protein
MKRRSFFGALAASLAAPHVPAMPVAAPVIKSIPENISGGIYDPGHYHGVYDPGHSHTYYEPYPYWNQPWHK